MASKYFLVSETSTGNISIHAQVFKAIAKGAIAEVDGVSQMFDSVTAAITEAFNTKKHRNGVEIEFENGGLVIDAYVNIKAGVSIAEVAKNIQERVHNTVYTMTGLKTKAVYVHVVSIDFA